MDAVEPTRPRAPPGRERGLGRSVQHGTPGGPVREPHEGHPGSSVQEAEVLRPYLTGWASAPEPPPDSPSSLD